MQTLLLLLVLAAPPQAPPVLDKTPQAPPVVVAPEVAPARITTASEAALILLQSGANAGSATVVVKDGKSWILTAAHCVTGDSGYTVSRTRSGVRTPVRLVAKNLKTDLAVLVPDSPLPGIPLADSDPSPNAEATFYGLGGGHELTQKRGRILGHAAWWNYNQPFGGTPMLRSSIPSRAGDSGAGTISGGKLVAVNTGGDTSQGSYGSSTAQIRALMTGLTVSHQQAMTETSQAPQVSQDEDTRPFVPQFPVQRGVRDPDGDGTGIGDTSKCILVPGKLCEGGLLVPSPEVIEDLRSKGFDVSRLVSGDTTMSSSNTPRPLREVADRPFAVAGTIQGTTVQTAAGRRRISATTTGRTIPTPVPIQSVGQPGIMWTPCPPGQP